MSGPSIFAWPRQEATDVCWRPLIVAIAEQINNTKQTRDGSTDWYHARHVFIRFAEQWVLMAPPLATHYYTSPDIAVIDDRVASHWWEGGGGAPLGLIIHFPAVCCPGWPCLMWFTVLGIILWTPLPSIMTIALLLLRPSSHKWPMLRMGPRLELTVGTYIHIQNQDHSVVFKRFMEATAQFWEWQPGDVSDGDGAEHKRKLRLAAAWSPYNPYFSHSLRCFHATATATGTRVLFTRRGPGFSPWFYPISFCHEDVYFGFQNQLHQPTGHHQIYGFPQYIQDTWRMLSQWWDPCIVQMPIVWIRSGKLENFRITRRRLFMEISSAHCRASTQQASSVENYCS